MGSQNLFTFGASRWPGISKLLEECGEVVQVCGKLMGTRGGIAHWDGSDLGLRLEEELGDVLAAIDFVMERNSLLLNWGAISARRAQKFARFKQWHTVGEPPLPGGSRTTDRNTRRLEVARDVLGRPEATWDELHHGSEHRVDPRTLDAFIDRIVTLEARLAREAAP